MGLAHQQNENGLAACRTTQFVENHRRKQTLSALIYLQI